MYNYTRHNTLETKYNWARIGMVLEIKFAPVGMTGASILYSVRTGCHHRVEEGWSDPPVVVPRTVDVVLAYSKFQAGSARFARCHPFGGSQSSSGSQYSYQYTMMQYVLHGKDS